MKFFCSVVSIHMAVMRTMRRFFLENWKQSKTKHRFCGFCCWLRSIKSFFDLNHSQKEQKSFATSFDVCLARWVSTSKEFTLFTLVALRDFFESRKHSSPRRFHSFRGWQITILTSHNWRFGKPQTMATTRAFDENDDVVSAKREAKEIISENVSKMCLFNMWTEPKNKYEEKFK